MTAQPSPASNLTSQLRIRLTESERADLQREAEAAGVSLSELVRSRVLKLRRGSVRHTMNRAAEPPAFQAMHPALFAELSRIGNNLNQLTRALNSGQGASRAEVIRLVAEAWQTMLRDEVTARYAGAAEAKVRAKVQPA